MRTEYSLGLGPWSGTRLTKKSCHIFITNVTLSQRYVMKENSEKFKQFLEKSNYLLL
jgi:hypothetical protein